MTLTKAQIEQLYTFTQKHFVDWYDVQIELVDHLANGIEQQWQKSPEVPFNDALNIEFKKFGIMGFSDVIEQKTNALNTHYRKLVWNYFIGYFKLPKILLTTFFIWIYYSILTFMNIEFWVILTSCIGLTIVPFVFMYRQKKRITAVKKVTGKKWLVDAVVMQLGGIMYFFNIGMYVAIFTDPSKTTMSNTTLLIAAIIIVLLALVLYVSIFVVAPQLRAHVAKQHTVYKIS
ncbi:hypothetical protein RM697_05465 [Ichthyenterobacterium sp. W332]|uniref:Uncharacterized protein n=1 Tax=Microcosmobacter mediterraneus TaxID=3075607 RepID=A0ABU2YIT6_9FLAO|nr:hypothetical protein [Ichthyenterobacterium sp. W332]MDT0558082.1 hypothetical protein [Ichthyenterobacterium sp. W332]